MKFIKIEDSFRNLLRIQSNYLGVLTTIRDYLNIKDSDGVITNFSVNQHIYKETTNSVYDYNVDKWNSTGTDDRIIIEHHTLQFGFMLCINYFIDNIGVIIQKLNKLIVDNNLLVIEKVTTNQGFIGQELEISEQYFVRVNRKSGKIYTQRISTCQNP